MKLIDRKRFLKLPDNSVFQKVILKEELEYVGVFCIKVSTLKNTRGQLIGYTYYELKSEIEKSVVKVGEWIKNQQNLFLVCDKYIDKKTIQVWGTLSNGK